MGNIFEELEGDGKLPNSLKKEIVSEIDTLRNTMELVTLYVGNFFNTPAKMVSDGRNNTSDSSNIPTQEA